MAPTVITGMVVKDIRFPTSLEKHGSDAMHASPDYSCPYVTLQTDSTLEGHGITFTVGKGSEIENFGWSGRMHGAPYRGCGYVPLRFGGTSLGEWEHNNNNFGWQHGAPDYSCAYITIQTDSALEGHGHTFTAGRGTELAPDYSMAYVVLATDSPIQGHGSTFTCGRGTETVCFAVKALTKLIVGKKLADIFGNFGDYWREITNDDQARWIGPEKGVVHLAVAAVINALWDLWAKVEGKPLWKLLVDMDAEKLVNTIDFRYISDALTKEEAVAILKKMDSTKAAREKEMEEKGYPAYITSCGWLGYTDEQITKLATEAMADGYTRFKMKVGSDLEDDIRRAKIFRKVIGYDKVWCVDANQKWDVQESIDWMKALAPYKPLWIEEPTSPDDVLGHGEIAKALNPLDIGVATGEMCQNRVMFKQFLQAKAMQYCQIDACRLGGVNEVLSVILMAAKFNVPVCPHAGGVGLCELVQHYSLFDYIRCAGNLEHRMTEYADHLHEHMEAPVVINKGCYIPPKAPGFLVGIKPESVEGYEYPNGTEWQKLFDQGLFERE